MTGCLVRARRAPAILALFALAALAIARFFSASWPCAPSGGAAPIATAAAAAAAAAEARARLAGAAERAPAAAAEATDKRAPAACAPCVPCAPAACAACAPCAPAAPCTVAEPCAQCAPPAAPCAPAPAQPAAAAAQPAALPAQPAAAAAPDSPSRAFKSWIEAGFGEAALSYAYGAPAAPLAFLSAALPAACASPRLAPGARANGSFLVLIFGDSINRFMFEDGCAAAGGFAPDGARWTANFTYRVGASQSDACELPWGVMAFLNVYGAAARGPYYEDHGSHVEFKGDTAERVPEGLRQFAARWGRDPDAVIFRSEIWDQSLTLARVTAGLPWANRSAVMAAFARDVRAAFAGLRARLPRAVLGTHTTPTVNRGSGGGLTYFNAYTAALRAVARGLDDVFLADWNALTAPLDPADTQKDAMHPDGKYSGPFFAAVANAFGKWGTGCAREA